MLGRGKIMINMPLLRWEMYRFRWWYAGLLIFAVIVLAVLLVNLNPDAPVRFTFAIQAERHPFLSFGMFFAIFWGMGLFNRQFREGNVEFLLARPVGRRELFSTLVLVWGGPLVLLMFLPFLCALVLSPWFDFILPLHQLAAANFIAAVWVAAIYLLGVLWGLFIVRINTYLQTFLIAFLVAVFINTSQATGYSWLDLNFQIQHHPWLSMVIGLLLACLFHYLGLRRLERMDV